MPIHRLLVLPLLISVCAAPVAAQSPSDRSPSSASVCPTSKCPQAQTIRGEPHQYSFILERRNAIADDLGGVGGHSSTIIPPLQFHAIPPLAVGGLDPTLGQGDVCYSIRSYRVTRDDPESDSTRPAGYSTCQPAARFHVKDVGDLREIVPR